MTKNNIRNLIMDYNGGNGLSNPKLAKKYGVTPPTIRNILIREGVYKPQRNFYKGRAPIDVRYQQSVDLLKKIANRHETGLLPCRYIYDEIISFLYGQQK